MSVSAMPVLLQATKLLGDPMARAVYQLLLLMTVGVSLGMAWGEWRRTRGGEAQRLLLGAAGLTFMRAVYIVAALATMSQSAVPQALLPPIERFVDLGSVALLSWALVRPAKRGVAAWDLILATNLFLAAGACAGFTVVWNQVWTSDSTLDYNVYWQATVWSIWQMSLILLALFSLIQTREAGWGPTALAMALMLLGQVMQLRYPSNAVNLSLPSWQRLSNVAAYPLVAVAFYQRIIAGLRLHSRQLQEVSQASLDQIKSLLHLFEASQRMSSSLDLSMILENAVHGVARALEADQCAIALPSESDPGQMRLEAIYNPTRRARRDVATFPVEYQLAVQQATRRKDHVIVDAPDNVQLRALFALMGSSQTGPLLVLPLLASDEPIGVLIVGNGQSRRRFAPNEVKLCQTMAGQVVTAVQNSRRYWETQDRIAELTKAQTGVLRTSQEAESQVRELTERLASTAKEMEVLRQARDALEIKLASSRAEATALSKRVAISQTDWRRRDAQPAGSTWTILSGAPAGILLSDDSGLIQAANSGAETLLGQRRQALEGRTLERVSDDEQWRRAAAAAVSGAAAQLILSVGTNTLLCDMVPLPERDPVSGPTKRLVVILHPLSTEAEAERARLETVAALAEELRPPMTTIVGYADLLLSEAMGSVSEVQRKFLMRIKAGAQRMVQMIQNLLVEARGEEQPSYQRHQAVELDELVDEVLGSARVQIEDKSLTVDVQVPHGLPTVKADPEQLRRVLSCLVSNACLASPVGGRIEVLVTMSPSDGVSLDRGLSEPSGSGFVTVAVRDSGGGLSKDGLSHVFTRTRPSRTPPGLGESGVGLAQARALVEAQGGFLSVASEEGVGITVSVVLPVDEGAD